jgi:hypothetical protein
MRKLMHASTLGQPPSVSPRRAVMFNTPTSIPSVNMGGIYKHGKSIIEALETHRYHL